MKNIIKISGGFHNAREIRIRNANIYQQVEDNNGGCRGTELTNLEDVLTPSQQQKLSRHFCSGENCTCGGYYRAIFNI